MDGTSLILFVFVGMFLTILALIANSLAKIAKMARSSAEALQTTKRLASLKLLIEIEKDEKMRDSYIKEVYAIHFRLD